MRLGPAIALAASTWACLDPLVDESEVEFVFGVRGVEGPDDAPLLEEDPAFREEVALFPDRLPYLRGFAKGRVVWFWDVPGPMSEAVPPFFLLERDGQPLGLPIVDTIPGQTGYGPWWRLVRVPVTDDYDDEPIWSRAGIDEALRRGLVETPIETRRIINAPVVTADTLVQFVPSDPEQVRSPTRVWYRKRIAFWVRFSLEQELDTNLRSIPVGTLNRLQRVNQPFLLSEDREQFDLDGDGRQVSTNDIFEFGPEDLDYTAAWTERRVRTRADYESFDDGTPELAEHVGLDSSPLVVGTEQIPGLLACPLQREPGEL
ncbi:MAG: hypothetical protein AAF851_13605 [Myxococcota bacterium]